MQYSDEVKSEFKLNTYNDKAQALGALQNIRYRGGNTRTGTVDQNICRPSLSKVFGVEEPSVPGLRDMSLGHSNIQILNSWALLMALGWFALR